MSDYKTKVQRKFSYHGAGYEVILHHVPMIKVGGEWILDMDLKSLERLIFEELPHHPSRLTGNQVRFIRDYTDMTLKAFAERFGVSHAAVKKWENAGDGPTNMAWSTEKDIRLFVLMHGDPEASAFRQCYLDLIDEPSSVSAPIHLDLEVLAAV